SPSASTTCSRCAVGSYDDDEDPATPCVACPAGSYSDAGAYRCTPCAEHTYDHDLDAATPCILCPAGQDRNVTMVPATSCFNCPVGFYRLVGAADGCRECGVGFDCAAEGLGQRWPCPSGTKGNGTHCLECPDHTYSPEGASECEPCL